MNELIVGNCFIMRGEHFLAQCSIGSTPTTHSKAELYVNFYYFKVSSKIFKIMSNFIISILLCYISISR